MSIKPQDAETGTAIAALPPDVGLTIAENSGKSGLDATCSEAPRVAAATLGARSPSREHPVRRPPPVSA